MDVNGYAVTRFMDHHRCPQSLATVVMLAIGSACWIVTKRNTLKTGLLLRFKAPRRGQTVRRLATVTEFSRLTPSPTIPPATRYTPT